MHQNMYVHRYSYGRKYMYQFWFSCFPSFTTYKVFEAFEAILTDRRSCLLLYCMPSACLPDGSPVLGELRLRSLALPGSPLVPVCFLQLCRSLPSHPHNLLLFISKFPKNEFARSHHTLQHTLHEQLVFQALLGVRDAEMKITSSFLYANVSLFRRLF